MYIVLLRSKGKIFTLSDENGKPYTFKTEEQAFTFVQKYELHLGNLKIIIVEEQDWVTRCVNPERRLTCH